MADHWGYVPRSYEDWRGGANDRISTTSLWFLAWTTKCPRARSCAVFPMASVGSTLSWCADPGAGWARLRLADSHFASSMRGDAANWRSASMPRTHQGDPAVRTSRDADRPAVRDLWQRTSGRNRADRCRRSVRAGDSERVAPSASALTTFARSPALKVINMLKVIKVLNLVGAGADESLAATVLGSPSVTALRLGPAAVPIERLRIEIHHHVLGLGVEIHGVAAQLPSQAALLVAAEWRLRVDRRVVDADVAGLQAPRQGVGALDVVVQIVAARP